MFSRYLLNVGLTWCVICMCHKFPFMNSYVGFQGALQINTSSQSPCICALSLIYGWANRSTKTDNGLSEITKLQQEAELMAWSSFSARLAQPGCPHTLSQRLNVTAAFHSSLGKGRSKCTWRTRKLFSSGVLLTFNPNWGSWANRTHVI